MLKETINEEIPVFSGADINQVLDLAQKSHENYLLRANVKDLDRALLYYLEAIRINPVLPEPHYKLASLLWEKGDIDLNSAIKHCKKAVELSPKSANARLYLGYFLKASGRYAEAEVSFHEAIKLGSFRSSKARLVLSATILERAKEYGTNSQLDNICDFFRSAYYFSTGVALSVYDYEITRMLYRVISDKTSIFKYEADAAIHKCVRNYKKSVEIYEKAAVKTEQKEHFYSRIADLFQELQNPEKAEEYYRLALDDNPDDVLMWMKLADILQNQRKRSTGEIIECYNNVARLDPNNAKVYYELGHLYLRHENKFNAVNAFKRALELEPKNAFYHNSLAYALVQLQDYDGAMCEYQQAIRINPDNEWTSIVAQALGAIYYQIKENLDAAIVSYQLAMVLDPNNIDALISLGEAYQEKGDLDNAIKCFCSAINLKTDSPKIYCYLGLLLWEKGYIDEAVVSCQKAISLDPEYAVAMNNLGVIYLDGKCNPEEALGMFSLAIKYSPNYTLVYYNMGRAYRMLDDRTKAAEYFQMAYDMNVLTGEMDGAEIQDRIYELFA
jgi:tetratricopeptide (TPR) repeat protein